MRRLEVAVESWPIAGKFTISRGSRTEARVVVARIEENGIAGRGRSACLIHAMARAWKAWRRKSHRRRM